MKITLSLTWKDGSMLFVHAIRDKDDMVVSVLMEPLPRDGKIIFKMSRATFEELCELAEANTEPDRDGDNGEEIERPSKYQTQISKYQTKQRK